VEPERHLHLMLVMATAVFLEEFVRGSLQGEGQRSAGRCTVLQIAGHCVGSRPCWWVNGLLCIWEVLLSGWDVTCGIHVLLVYVSVTHVHIHTRCVQHGRLDGYQSSLFCLGFIDHSLPWYRSAFCFRSKLKKLLPVSYWSVFSHFLLEKVYLRSMCVL